MENETALPRRAGRPSIFSAEIAERILELFCDGRSLTEISELPEMPDRRTIQRWQLANAEFRQACITAREIGADLVGETAYADTQRTYLPEQVGAARLRLDGSKWFLAVISRRWSDRSKHEISGPDGAPLQITAVQAPLTPPEVTKAIRELLSEAERAVGLPSTPDASDAERMKAVLASGKPIPPSLYRVLHAAKSAG